MLSMRPSYWQLGRRAAHNENSVPDDTGLLSSRAAPPKISPCPPPDDETRSTCRLLSLHSTSDPRPSSPRSGLFSLGMEPTLTTCIVFETFPPSIPTLEVIETPSRLLKPGGVFIWATRNLHPPAPSVRYAIKESCQQRPPILARLDSARPRPIPWRRRRTD